MENNLIVESPENYEMKCCCTLVLDVSSSMEGNPIKELNEGLKGFYKDIQTDSTTANRLEIAVVEFSSSVNTLIDPSLAGGFNMPTLTTKGSTRLVDGVREGINIVRSRKAWYKKTSQKYYRPWIILITDGAPDEGQDIIGLSKEIKDGMSKKEFFFLALGVQGADMDMLANISDPSWPPAKLQGLKFLAFFNWLSSSMTAVTNSKDGDKVVLPENANWKQPLSV